MKQVLGSQHQQNSAVTLVALEIFTFKVLSQLSNPIKTCLHAHTLHSLL